jgi:hypothetical protein
MDETTVEVVLDGYRMALETARLAQIPLAAITVASELASEISAENLVCPVIAMRRIVQPPFAQSLERRTTGPLFVVS